MKTENEQTNACPLANYKNIKSEYEKSLAKLLPLKEELRKTDCLIDQIVYKLYGLIDEEIKLWKNLMKESNE